MERRTTLADARRPPASARPSVGGGGSCARRAWPSLLRMRLLQPWFNLSGEGVGDAVCGPRAFSEFTGVPLGLGDQVPDAATPLKIRRGGGSIADAAFAEAPSSARNAKGGRDPEARQARKGRNWHSGYQAPVGVDAGSGPVHTVGATAANVNDVVIACALVREDGPFCHAGSGYTGTGDSPRVASGLAGIGRNMPENALAGT